MPSTGRASGTARIRLYASCFLITACAATAGAPRSEEPAAVAELRRQVESGGYDAWNAREPARARTCRAALAERLAAFEAPERDAAIALITRLGADGIDALVRALSHKTLAVRAACHALLLKRIQDPARSSPGPPPFYDAWAPSARRDRMARDWQTWWKKRQALAARR